MLMPYRFCIYYDSTEPLLFVRDLNLIQRICIKDFDHFIDNGLFPSECLKLKENNFGLINTVGEEWRSLKSSITPAFSLRNMKNVAVAVNPLALEAVEYLRKFECQEVNLNRLMSFYAMDCIGKIAFSIDFKSILMEGSEMTKTCGDMFETWRIILVTLFPTLTKWLKFPFVKISTMVYIQEFSKNIMKQREGMANPPNDVTQLMMRVRDNELKAQEEEIAQYGIDTSHITNYMTTDMIARTLTQFFLDGYDMVQNAISNTLYFIAINPDVQDKAQAEIDEIYEACGGVLSGDWVNKLKYLECCFNEAGRFSPFPNTTRCCTKDWTIPGTNITIPKGTRVMIPIIGVHMDPDNFPNPEKYDPERFSGENRAKIKTGSYLQFGVGPRQCIGIKFARIEAKVAMFQILRHFRLEVCERTIIPHRFSKDHISRLEGDVWVRPVPRNV